MKQISSFLIGLLIFLTAMPSMALYTELGVNYGRKKTTFDADNYLDSESMTGSISLYFLERLALELSYTEAVAKREEKAGTSDPKRSTTQKSTVMGADLILTFADRKALFQPYIKGGIAQIERHQSIKIEGQDAFTLTPETAAVPSYGLGIKIAVTESFGIKFSYDIWKTPIGDGNQTDDTSLRAGVTWAL